MNKSFFHTVFEESIHCKQIFIQEYLAVLPMVADAVIERLKRHHTLFFFGNGGSAADAQHLAAEFVNRLEKHRPALPAVALTTDSSILTSIANDYDFTRVFARQLDALAGADDIAIAISTSGNSPNLIEAIRTARRLKMLTIGFLGQNGGQLKSLVDWPLVVSSNSPQRIQETHITLGHALCEYIEMKLFPSSPMSL